MARGNPYSFLRINKTRLEFDDSVSPYSDEVYQRGRDNLSKLIADSIMVRDPEDSLYLYRLTWQSVSQTGLVTLTSVEEYDRGLIKKHEHTSLDTMNDRANHISVLGAQAGPVFSTFKATARITTLLSDIASTKPELDFEADDHVRHELWVINSPETLSELVAAFDELGELYIADGHHRSAAASEVCRRNRERLGNVTGREPFNFFLNVLFPDNQLRILPYNRVVRDLQGMTPEQLLEKAVRKFAITESDGEVVPDAPRTFGVYVDGRWYRMTSRAGSFPESSPTESIDASILANNFLDPVLGIKDSCADKRISFVGGIRGNAELVKLVDSGEYAIAFSLFATTVDQLLRVADAGEVMPPKSTWFEPKLRSGMVVNLLTNE
jgi:uncharacterized protein (DUF1015 family)